MLWLRWVLGCGPFRDPVRECHEVTYERSWCYVDITDRVNRWLCPSLRQVKGELHDICFRLSLVYGLKDMFILRQTLLRWLSLEYEILGVWGVLRKDKELAQYLSLFGWNRLAQDSIQSRALANTEINHMLLCKGKHMFIFFPGDQIFSSDETFCLLESFGQVSSSNCRRGCAT